MADCLWLAYLLQSWIDSVRGFSSGCTATLNTAMTGTGASVVALNTFTAPALPLTPVAVTAQLPGSLTRIFTAVQDMKNSHKLTDTIAAELKLVGSELNGPELSTLQPIISAKVSGNKVEIIWNWGGNRKFLDACEILVNRNDGNGWVPLVIDTTPDYNDTTAFPATKAIWDYKAIYRVDDAQVGQWSQVASVTVGA